MLWENQFRGSFLNPKIIVFCPVRDMPCTHSYPLAPHGGWPGPSRAPSGRREAASLKGASLWAHGEPRAPLEEQALPSPFQGT